ncbi:hypothetical protein DASC09_021480 [Saccharomycopsis crataegensis]|uniref:Uncharacterized protein n=1 Tax=Saccharomycopsis crataegensis TaxID=43959 RepID=A0AAV5QJ72_9ASCO|nr:hypothetical protein DASC09_021480 [Saccharomycopsis crataegensis]
MAKSFEEFRLHFFALKSEVHRSIRIQRSQRKHGCTGKGIAYPDSELFSTYLKFLGIDEDWKSVVKSRSVEDDGERNDNKRRKIDDLSMDNENIASVSLETKNDNYHKKLKYSSTSLISDKENTKHDKSLAKEGQLSDEAIRTLIHKIQELREESIAFRTQLAELKEQCSKISVVENEIRLKFSKISDTVERVASSKRESPPW